MAKLECDLASMHVSDVTRYDHCHRQLYSDSAIVTRLLGQIKIDTGPLYQESQPDVKIALYDDCIGDICIFDIISN